MPALPSPAAVRGQEATRVWEGLLGGGGGIKPVQQCPPAHPSAQQLLTSQTMRATKMKNAATEGFSPAAQYLQGAGCRGQGGTLGGWVRSVRKQNKSRLCAR